MQISAEKQDATGVQLAEDSPGENRSNQWLKYGWTL